MLNYVYHLLQYKGQPFQTLFQEPFISLMLGITDLRYTTSYYLIVIFNLVSWLLFVLLMNANQTHDHKVSFTHYSLLKIIVAVIAGNTVMLTLLFAQPGLLDVCTHLTFRPLADTFCKVFHESEIESKMSRKRPKPFSSTKHLDLERLETSLEAITSEICDNSKVGNSKLKEVSAGDNTVMQLTSPDSRYYNCSYDNSGGSEAYSEVMSSCLTARTARGDEEYLNALAESSSKVKKSTSKVKHANRNVYRFNEKKARFSDAISNKVDSYRKEGVNNYEVYTVNRGLKVIDVIIKDQSSLNNTWIVVNKGGVGYKVPTITNHLVNAISVYLRKKQLFLEQDIKATLPDPSEPQFCTNNVPYLNIANLPLFSNKQYDSILHKASSMHEGVYDRRLSSLFAFLVPNKTLTLIFCLSLFKATNPDHNRGVFARTRSCCLKTTRGMFVNDLSQSLGKFQPLISVYLLMQVRPSWLWSWDDYNSQGLSNKEVTFQTVRDYLHSTHKDYGVGESSFSQVMYRFKDLLSCPVTSFFVMVRRNRLLEHKVGLYLRKLVLTIGVNEFSAFADCIADAELIDCLHKLTGLHPKLDPLKCGKENALFIAKLFRRLAVHLQITTENVLNHKIQLEFFGKRLHGPGKLEAEWSTRDSRAEKNQLLNSVFGSVKEGCGKTPLRDVWNDALCSVFDQLIATNDSMLWYTMTYEPTESYNSTVSESSSLTVVELSEAFYKLGLESISRAPKFIPARRIRTSQCFPTVASKHTVWAYRDLYSKTPISGYTKHQSIRPFGGKVSIENPENIIWALNTTPGFGFKVNPFFTSLVNIEKAIDGKLESLFQERRFISNLSMQLKLKLGDVSKGQLYYFLSNLYSKVKAVRCTRLRLEQSHVLGTQSVLVFRKNLHFTGKIKPSGVSFHYQSGPIKYLCIASQGYIKANASGHGCFRRFISSLVARIKCGRGKPVLFCQDEVLKKFLNFCGAKSLVNCTVFGYDLYEQKKAIFKHFCLFNKSYLVRKFPNARKSLLPLVLFERFSCLITGYTSFLVHTKINSSKLRLAALLSHNKRMLGNLCKSSKSRVDLPVVLMPAVKAIIKSTYPEYANPCQSMPTLNDAILHTLIYTNNYSGNLAARRELGIRGYVDALRLEKKLFTGYSLAIKSLCSGVYKVKCNIENLESADNVLKSKPFVMRMPDNTLFTFESSRYKVTYGDFNMQTADGLFVTILDALERTISRQHRQLVSLTMQFKGKHTGGLPEYTSNGLIGHPNNIRPYKLLYQLLIASTFATKPFNKTAFVRLPQSYFTQDEMVAIYDYLRNNYVCPGLFGCKSCKGGTSLLHHLIIEPNTRNIDFNNKSVGSSASELVKVPKGEMALKFKEVFDRVGDLFRLDVPSL